jgi:OOP family OmpA-OmpF porin
MRSTGTMTLALLCSVAGCTSVVELDETTPVQIRGERPPPPPPPPEPPPRVEVEETRIRVDEKIHFAFDEATIESDSDSLLQEIAQVIIDNPQVVEIRVEGHTDSQGSAEYNEELSDRRANAVVDRLVENGVDRERLEPVGYGLTRPIADNETDEGRATNRRVEFNILERDDSLRPAEGGAEEADEGDEAEETGDEDEEDEAADDEDDAADEEEGADR